MSRTTDTLFRIMEEYWITIQRVGISAAMLRDQLPSSVIPPATATDKGGVALSDSTPANIGTAAPGTATAVSRRDHVHAHGNQSANLVLSGPASGAAAAPTFRALVALDIPNLDTSKLTTGTLAQARGGTGVSNAGTLTNASNTTITGGGTLALAGFTLTAPATGTVALRGVANVFSEENTFDKITRLPMTSGTTGYGLRLWDGATDYGNLQSLDLGGASYMFFAVNRQYDGTAWQQLNARAGCTFQLVDNRYTFYSFPASSSVPTGRFGVTANGAFFVGTTTALTGAGDLHATGIIKGDSYAEMIEIAAPAAGAANTGRLFMRDNGAGKSQFCVIFNTGAIQVIATQP